MAALVVYNIILFILSITSSCCALQIMTSTMTPQKTITKPAIVLVDPITDYKQVINAGIQLDYDIISIQLPDVALPTKFKSFIPSELA